MQFSMRGARIENRMRKSSPTCAAKRMSLRAEAAPVAQSLSARWVRRASRWWERSKRKEELLAGSCTARSEGGARVGAGWSEGGAKVGAEV